MLATFGIATIFWPAAFALLVLAIMITGGLELSRLATLMGYEISPVVIVIAALVYATLAYFPHPASLELWGDMLVVLMSIVFALSRGVDNFAVKAGMTLFAAIYGSWLVSYLIVVRQLHGGLWYMLWMVVIIATTDIAGMLFGLWIGRSKLAPHLSPSKTWEGAIGAFLLATAVGTALSFLPQLGVPWWLGLAFSAAVSLSAEFGDLVESGLKRNAHVKDSGDLIAGHGGVMDRFDSYVFAGPVAYLVLLLAGRV